jgi:hypothetical protein
MDTLPTRDPWDATGNSEFIRIYNSGNIEAAINHYVKNHPKFRDIDANKKLELANYLGSHQGIVQGVNNDFHPSWMTEDDAQNLRDDWTGFSDMIVGRPASDNSTPKAYNPSAQGTAQPKKPVGSQDVLANARTNPNQAVQDQIEGRKMATQLRDQRYGNSPVASQQWDYMQSRGVTPSAALPEMYGMDKMRDLLTRNTGTQRSESPYAPAPSSQVGQGRDQAMANAMRLLNAGIITPDQMPSQSLSSDWNKKTPQNKDGTMVGDYMAQATNSGFYDSRDANTARMLQQDVSKPVSGPDWYYGTKDIPSMSLDNLRDAMPSTDMLGSLRGYQVGSQPNYANVPLKETHLRVQQDRPEYPDAQGRFSEYRVRSATENNVPRLLNTTPYTMRDTVGPARIPMPTMNPLDPRSAGIPTRKQSPRSMLTDYDFVGTNLLSPAGRTLEEVRGRRNAENFLQNRRQTR